MPSRPCKHKSERACVEKEELGKLYVGYGEFLYQRDWTERLKSMGFSENVI